jgi:hypothetical protein
MIIFDIFVRTHERDHEHVEKQARQFRMKLKTAFNVTLSRRPSR